MQSEVSKPTRVEGDQFIRSMNDELSDLTIDFFTNEIVLTRNDGKSRSVYFLGDTIAAYESRDGFWHWLSAYRAKAPLKMEVVHFDKRRENSFLKLCMYEGMGVVDGGLREVVEKVLPSTQFCKGTAYSPSGVYTGTGTMHHYDLHLLPNKLSIKA